MTNEQVGKKEIAAKTTFSFTAKTLVPNITYLDTKKSLYDALDAMGDKYGLIKRTLFKDSIRLGKKPVTFKNDYLKKFDITARQFNAIRYDLDGTISSAQELVKDRIETLERRIKSVSRWLKKKNDQIGDIRNDVSSSRLDKVEAIKKLRFAIHHKKRKLFTLSTKLDALRSDQTAGRIRICFGSNKLFRKQFNLSENGYTSHEEWLSDWRIARTSNVFSLGSKDETRGNQSCSFFSDRSLRIRLPNNLIGKYGKYLVIPGLSYAYGQQYIDQAMMNRTALTHRFVRENDKWYLHTTVDVPAADLVTINPAEIGCIGVDINAKEIAVSETDRFGNPVWSKTYPASVKEKGSNATLAIYGDIGVAIIDRALLTGKPIGCENLDFEKKKSSLREQGTRYSRMLSSFAYKAFLGNLQRRAMKNGIAVYSVNPAYTSVIGMINYMPHYGLTSHEAAAVAIARRVQKYTEAPAPSGNASSLPARNRGEHVWKHLSRIKKSGIVKVSHNLYAIRRSLQDFPGCGVSKSRNPFGHQPASSEMASDAIPVSKSRGLGKSGRESLTLIGSNYCSATVSSLQE